MEKTTGSLQSSGAGHSLEEGLLGGSTAMHGATLPLQEQLWITAERHLRVYKGRVAELKHSYPFVPLNWPSWGGFVENHGNRRYPALESRIETFLAAVCIL